MFMKSRSAALLNRSMLKFMLLGLAMGLCLATAANAGLEVWPDSTDSDGPPCYDGCCTGGPGPGGPGGGGPGGGPRDPGKPKRGRPRTASTGAPIHLLRGSVIERAVDLPLPPSPLSWSFVRTYDSGRIGVGSRHHNDPPGVSYDSQPDYEVEDANGTRWFSSLKGPYLHVKDGAIELYLDASTKRKFGGYGGTLISPEDYDATMEVIPIPDNEDKDDLDNDGDENENFELYKLTEHDTGTVLLFLGFDDDIDMQTRGYLIEITSREYIAQGKPGIALRYNVAFGYGAGFLSTVTPAYPQDAEYYYSFTYATNGWDRIAAIELIRGSTAVARAEYTTSYTCNNSDVGDTSLSDDLAQVKILKKDSDDSGSNFSIVHTTQYRYYVDGSSDGNRHQLKMVLEPDAVERITSAGNSSVNTPEKILTKADSYVVANGKTIADYASRSFKYYTAVQATNGNLTTKWGTENLQTKYGGSELVEARNIQFSSPGKIGLVKQETIGGSCASCSGVANSVKEYYYMQRTDPIGAPVVSRIVVEDTIQNGGSTPAYRTVYGLNSRGVLLREAKIEDPTQSTLKAWCKSTFYISDGVEYRMPSAHSAVDSDGRDNGQPGLKEFFHPTDNPNDYDTLNSDAGVIYQYRYVNQYYLGSPDWNKKIFDLLVKKGRDGGYYYISADDYGGGTNDKPTWLTVASYAYPVPTPIGADRKNLANANETLYEYAFWDVADTQVKKKTTTHPTVSTGENGSGVATTTEQCFDKVGRLCWTKDGEGYVNYHAYHPVTGQLSFSMVDVHDPSSPGSEITGGDNSGPSSADVKWDAWTAMGASTNLPTRGSGLPTGLGLVSKQEFDALGRASASIDPGGAKHFTLYNGVAILYEGNVVGYELFMYRFPYWDATVDKPLLPVQVTSFNDGGEVIESYELASSVATAASDLPTGVGTPTLANYVSWTRHFYNKVNGQLVKVLRYHDIDSSDSVDNVDYHVTAFDYDTLGRRSTVYQTVLSDSGWQEQITRTDYDVLDRVTATKRVVSQTGHSLGLDTDADSDLGTITLPSSPGLATLSTTEYDLGNVGDSNVTSSKSFYGLGTSDNVETLFKRTYRGHIRGIERKNAGTSFSPYTVSDVDWMGRTTATATYTSAPTWPTDYAKYVHDGDPTAPDPLASGYVDLTASYYDDLDRIFRTEHYPGTSSNRLQSNNYYDRNGRLVCTGDKYSAHTEYAYDGAGRQYQERAVKDAPSSPYTSGKFTYRAPAPHTTLVSMPAAGDAGLVKFSHLQFDEAGNAIAEHQFELNHSDTDGIDIDATTSYVRRTIYRWYDAANRLNHEQDYGAGNGGSTNSWLYSSVPTRNSSVTNWSSSVVRNGYARRTSYYYNSASQLEIVDQGVSTDGDEVTRQLTKTFYDDLGRGVYVAENFVDFAPGSTDPTGVGGGSNNDQDRATGWKYNGLDQVTDLKAYTSNSTSQLTKYLYENSYDAKLATETIYPDSTDTTSGGTDQVKRTYNLDGSLATLTDQRGVVHTYTYNNRRQLTLDGITSLGTSGIVDGSVLSIKREFDDRGRLTNLYSMPTSGGTGTYLNAIAYFYHDSSAADVGGSTGKYRYERQFHSNGSGASYTEYVDSSATSNVFNDQLRVYGYSFENTNVWNEFGDSTPEANSDTLSDRLGRITGLQFDPDGSGGVSPVTQTAYEYNGANRLVSANYVASLVRRRMYNATTNTNYDAFDRWGRTVRQQWDKYVVTPASSTPIDQFNYTVDLAGNRVNRDIPSTLYATNNRDQKYTYDGLLRLATMDEGALSGSPMTISSPTFEEDWTLDALGNWSGFVKKSDSTTTLNQTRQHNKVNEIDTNDVDNDGPGNSITASVGNNWADPKYDKAGNMTTMVIPAGSFDKTYTLKYDAWNRLVKVYDDVEAEDRLEMEYDGLHRLIVKQTDKTHDGTYDETRHYFYNRQWQVVEERFSVAGNPVNQYVWHPEYVDALAMRRYDANTNGSVADSGDGNYYYLQDANYSVTAIANGSGAVVERYAYTPYGEVTVLNGANGADLNGTVTEWAADSDGISDIGNVYLYTGRERDPETGLQLNRMRFYSSILGRWLNRDPGGRLESLQMAVQGPMMTIGRSHATVGLDPMISFAHSQDYPDGFSLYQYVRSQPTIFTDASGLKSDTCIKRCCRPIDSTGMNLIGRFGARVAGDHCFLAQKSGPECEDFKCGYGLIGNEEKGDLPRSEQEGPSRGFSKVTGCSDCRRQPQKLKYGSGQGKPGQTATDDELMDCIKNSPARCDYSMLGYNCHMWNNEASSNCGLDCLPRFDPVDPGIHIVP